MTQWVVEYFVEEDGAEPVREFLDRLPPKDAAKVARTLDMLEEFGTQLAEPYVKKVAGYDLWELRVRRGSNQYRLFYVARAGRRFVVLHGFQKKTAKIPVRELETAQRRLDDLNRRERQ